MEKRLVKIAKELNVGTATIVEHLTKSGYEIENKPTAKVTDEMYSELLKEFQKSIAIKEQADQLVIGTRPATPKKESAPVHKTETPPPTPPVEKKATTPEEEKAPPAEKASEETPRTAPKLKILGKIDLGGRLRGGAKDKDAPAPVKEEPKEATPPPPPTPEKPKPEPEPEVKPEVTAEAKPAEKETKPETKPEPEVKQPEPKPKAEAEAEKTTKEVPAPKVEEKRVEAKKEEKPEVKKEPTPPQPKETPRQEAKPEAKKDESTPESEASEKPADGDELLRAKTPELRGLKILGKIDTDKFKKPKKKKKPQDKPQDAKAKAQTPGGGSGDKSNNANNTNNNDDARKKRKRKRKKVVAGPDSGARGNDRRRGQNDGRSSRRPTSRDEVKEVSKKEIEDKIKATMARISGKGKKKRQKIRRDNRERMREKQEALDMEAQNDKLQLTEFVSVSELASLMDVPVTDVITTCMNLGVIVSINQRLDAEVIELVASEFDHEVEFISVEDQVEEEEEDVDDPEDLVPRAPIVAVMGHVDHGKTSLLDYIRSANVAEGEAGGITQHIGAYEVKVGPDEKKVTFLDTPGHEAFTAMRARGAKVTDIAVIIISADDSIMPQTREAISHSQAAGVPIVFAINKIDKEGAQPERIKQELANMNFLVEEWGGKYQSQDISAKNGQNIDLLLEKIVLEAELLELKANPDRASSGTVIEASLDKGRGYVTKMLVQNGTLNIGDPIVAGEHSGKVKAMFNEHGKRIKAAGPSTPVLVLGLSGAPQAGERFKETESEQDARQIAVKRAQIIREQTTRATKRISLDEIGRRLALGSFKELNLIVKGDVDGSVEALSDSLIKMSIESVQVNVIHKAVGQIIESDVLLASASDAIIIGFQVRPSLGARKLAEREGVQIKTYSIIYEAIEEIKLAIEGMLDTIKEEKIVCQLDVRNVFKISKIGTVAGCLVQEGTITRNTNVRIVRNGIVVYPTKEGAVGEIASLKRFKDDVKEVKNGMECGVSIKNFNDLKAGDVIEGFEIVEIKQTL